MTIKNVFKSRTIKCTGKQKNIIFYQDESRNPYYRSGTGIVMCGASHREERKAHDGVLARRNRSPPLNETRTLHVILVYIPVTAEFFFFLISSSDTIIDNIQLTLLLK